MTAAGHDPVRVPHPRRQHAMYLFQQTANTPALILPIADHDDDRPAASENMRLQKLWDGIDVYVALFERPK